MQKSGLARTTEFLTVKAVTDWLERQAEPLHRQFAWHRSVQAQITARRSDAPSQSMVLKMKAWLNREDPKAKELLGKELGVTIQDNPEKLGRTKKAMERDVGVIESRWSSMGLEAPKIGRNRLARSWRRCFARRVICRAEAIMERKYEQKPSLGGPLTMTDLYRAIVRLARIVEAQQKIIDRLCPDKSYDI